MSGSGPDLCDSPNNYRIMQTRSINPHGWQAGFGYQQAVEVRGANSTLYVAGQAAIAPDGTPSEADMLSQLNDSIGYLEEVLDKAGYAPSNIVRLTVYTTDHDGLLPHFPVLTEWLNKNNVQSAMTLLTVRQLYGPLKVELEATAVR